MLAFAGMFVVTQLVFFVWVGVLIRSGESRTSAHRWEATLLHRLRVVRPRRKRPLLRMRPGRPSAVPPYALPRIYLSIGSTTSGPLVPLRRSDDREELPRAA
jgi:hypothetical protein